jgi:hypothetical protein
LTACLVAAALLVACGGIEPDLTASSASRPEAEAIPADAVQPGDEAGNTGDAQDPGGAAGQGEPGDQPGTDVDDPPKGYDPDHMVPQVLRIHRGGRMLIALREDQREQLRQAFTLETWFNADHQEDQILLSADQLRIEVRYDSVMATVGGQELRGGRFAAGEWYHVALERRDETVALYVNGALMDIALIDGEAELSWEEVTVAESEFSGRIDNLRLAPEPLYNEQDFIPEQDMVPLGHLVFGFDFDQNLDGSDPRLPSSGAEIEVLYEGETELVDGTVY